MKIKKALSWIRLLTLNPNRIKIIRWMFLCFKNPNTVTEFILADGSKFVYPLNSAIGRSLSFDNFEPLELSFVLDSLQKGDIFFDVGANGGFFTIAAAKKIGSSGHVYAFEPSMREQALLKHNIEINELKNVTIVNAAVGNNNQKIKFVISEDGALNSIKKTKHPSQIPQSEVQVDMLTLDSFVKENSISEINFIKVDVEGAEKIVFQGSQQILSSMNPIILFEANDFTSSAFGYSKEDLFSELFAHQYTVKTWGENSRLTSIEKLDVQDVIKKYNNFIATKKG